jgi:hypothetical protein
MLCALLRQPCRTQISTVFAIPASSMTLRSNARKMCPQSTSLGPSSTKSRDCRRWASPQAASPGYSEITEVSGIKEQLRGRLIWRQVTGHCSDHPEGPRMADERLASCAVHTALQLQEKIRPAWTAPGEQVPRAIIYGSTGHQGGRQREVAEGSREGPLTFLECQCSDGDRNGSLESCQETGSLCQQLPSLGAMQAGCQPRQGLQRSVGPPWN